MTDDEKAVIEKWIIGEVSEVDVVPGDEGNIPALCYNLIHLLREGRNFRHYHYELDQDIELKELGLEE